MIESDLYIRLKNDTAVNALVNGRISAIKAEQNVIKPYITYQVISGNSEQCISGIISEEITRFQIDIWGTTYSNVKAIKTAVIESLIGFKNSHSFSYMDDYESDTGLYRQMIDFKLKG